MSNIVEIKLGNGWRVRCRAVPTLAFNGIMRTSEYWYPPLPKIEIPVQKGTATETIDAPEGSPEFIEYQKTVTEIENKRREEQSQFCYAYGVVEWVKGAGKKWSREPPRGWEPDQILVDALGLQDTPDRTVFIMYELLAASADLGRVDEIILDLDKEPLKGGEVQAAEDSFQGDVEG